MGVAASSNSVGHEHAVEPRVDDAVTGTERHTGTVADKVGQSVVRHDIDCERSVQGVRAVGPCVTGAVQCSALPHPWCAVQRDTTQSDSAQHKHSTDQQAGMTHEGEITRDWDSRYLVVKSYLAWGKRPCGRMTA